MAPPLGFIQYLAGTWFLINNTAIYGNGTLIPGENSATGAHPIGLIHYSVSGYMSANIMTSNPDHRPTNIQWPPQKEDSDADWALVGRHVMTYAGPYSVDIWNETHGTLVHGPLIYAGSPDWVGTNQTRNYTFFDDGDTLRLQAKNKTSGNLATLFWRRLPPSWEATDRDFTINAA